MTDSLTVKTIRSGDRGHVSFGALCRHGKHAATVVGRNNRLCLGYTDKPPAPSQVTNVSSVAFRTFMREDQSWGHELLYTITGHGGVNRWDLEKQCTRTRIATSTKMDAVPVLTESTDGRFVCFITEAGHLEVWNFDGAEPTIVFELDCYLSGSPSCAAFHHANRLLAIATTGGQIAVCDLSTGAVLNLHANQDWPCFALAWQPDHYGLVCGGEGDKLWMMNVRSRGNHEVYLDDLPLDPSKVVALNGNGFVPMPGTFSSISCLKTTIGILVNQLHFLDATRLAVRGAQGVEVWDVIAAERLKVGRINKDTRTQAMCGQDDSVFVLREM